MVPGEGSRPLGDRPKEALFNILGPLIAQARFLDLFAGTGSVGIEALSRGAAAAVFIDNSSAAIRTVRANLDHTHLSDRSRVIQGDSFQYLERPSPKPFDLIFVAPPQYRGLWIKTLKSLDRRPEWLNPDGSVIVQIDPNEYVELALENLVQIDRRKYGATLLVFYERPGD